MCDEEKLQMVMAGSVGAETDKDHRLSEFSEFMSRPYSNFHFPEGDTWDTDTPIHLGPGDGLSAGKKLFNVLSN